MLAVGLYGWVLEAGCAGISGADESDGPGVVRCSVATPFHVLGRAHEAVPGQCTMVTYTLQTLPYLSPDN